MARQFQVVEKQANEIPVLPISSRYSLPTYAKPVPSSRRKVVMFSNNASFSLCSLYGWVIPVNAKSYGPFTSSCACPTGCGTISKYEEYCR